MEELVSHATEAPEEVKEEVGRLVDLIKGRPARRPGESGDDLPDIIAIYDRQELMVGNVTWSFFLERLVSDPFFTYGTGCYAGAVAASAL